MDDRHPELPAYRLKRDKWSGTQYWSEVSAKALESSASAAEIARQIALIDPPIKPIPKDDRTIREHVARIRAAAAAIDPTSRWPLVQKAQTPDPAVVATVLAWRIADGARRPLTEDQAAWITSIYRVAPDLGPSSLTWAAVAYQSAIAEGKTTSDLDAQLAMAPWRGPAESFAYRRACEIGTIRPTRLPLASATAEAERRDQENRRQRLAAGLVVED